MSLNISKISPLIRNGIVIVTVTIVVFVLLSYKDLLSKKENFITKSETTEIMNSDSNQVTNIFKFHYDNILVDTHNDFLWQSFYRNAPFGRTDYSFDSDKVRFKEGGVDVQVFAVWIPMNKVKTSYKFVVQQINKLEQLALTYSDDLELANSYDDIIRIVDSGKLCGLIGVEGGTAIHSDLENVSRLYSKGVRYIGLTWNNSNNIATSAKDEKVSGVSGGLTPFGKSVIKKMNELGIMVDVSHLGERAFWDLVETTNDPILASHSNAYSINPHYRNLTDDQIKAIAKSGGVIQVNFYDLFLNKNVTDKKYPDARDLYAEQLDSIYSESNGDLIKFNELRYEFLMNYRSGSVTTVDLLIDHIDHIVNLVGIDYVGIGSDFDGGISTPFELYDVSTYPVLTKRLFDRGYTTTDIKKILGLNFLRVFKEVCG